MPGSRLGRRTNHGVEDDDVVGLTLFRETQNPISQNAPHSLSPHRLALPSLPFALFSGIPSRVHHLRASSLFLSFSLFNSLASSSPFNLPISPFPLSLYLSLSLSLLISLPLFFFSLSPIPQAAVAAAAVPCCLSFSRALVLLGRYQF